MRLSSWQADAMLSADGKALIFVSDAPTEREQFMSPNIYVSLLGENGEWGKPFELGPTINTPYIDRSPFLHPDMKTLYFASEGHGSLGGLDVYMTTRLNPDSWTEWSEPINLGKQINTAGNDCWYKISTDGTMAYLSRSTANNMQDICWLPLPGYLRAEPMSAVVAEDTLVMETIVRLNNIFFPFGSAQLLSTSEPELERVLKALKGTSNHYEIAGHTDNVGSAEANQLLSERRAAAVRDWLVEHGCAADRLTVRGYGE
jgi:outer membrane protein OmpA-like peptidoglycan-associated protein